MPWHGLLEANGDSMRIEKHVGIFDDVIPADLCNKFIQYYDNAEASGATKTRMEAENTPPHVKDDSACLIEPPFFLNVHGMEFVAVFMDIFWSCYKEYANVYHSLNESARANFYNFKLQKTKPGQGYHVWHFENGGRFVGNRSVTWMVYLNDVAEGGETEFLFEHTRVSPKAGRLLLWPASYTHTHRGNPPLSNDKYVATGWVEFFE